MGKKIKHSSRRAIAEKFPPSLSHVDKKANTILEKYNMQSSKIVFAFIHFWELTLEILPPVLAIPFQTDTVRWAIESPPKRALSDGISLHRVIKQAFSLGRR